MPPQGGRRHRRLRPTREVCSRPHTGISPGSCSWPEPLRARPRPGDSRGRHDRNDLAVRCGPGQRPERLLHAPRRRLTQVVHHLEIDMPPQGGRRHRRLRPTREVCSRPHTGISPGSCSWPEPLRARPRPGDSRGRHDRNDLAVRCGPGQRPERLLHAPRRRLTQVVHHLEIVDQFRWHRHLAPVLDTAPARLRVTMGIPRATGRMSTPSPRFRVHFGWIAD